jgi:uncharacterized protein YqeY
MNLKEQLQADLKEAMKSGDAIRKTTIRMALAAIKNAEVEKIGELDEGETLALLQKEVRQRRESIEEAEQAGRDDLVKEGESEIVVLEGYLPAQLSREEIAAHAQAAIEETGAASPKDMGNVMRVLMPKLKGQADGKLVNEVVRELLASGG